MTFQDLDSNFEKKVKETNEKPVTAEEKHLNQSQVETDKPKYESIMGEQPKTGLLSVFQDRLSSIRRPTDNSDSFDTITVTADDIITKTPAAAAEEVSPEQIESLLKSTPNKSEESPAPVASKNPIQDTIQSDNVEFVSEKTQVPQTETPQSVIEETVHSVKPKRYEEDHPTQEKIAKYEDSISQIAVLRAANGEMTSLGTDGKTLEDDFIAHQIQKHKEQKEKRREAGEASSSETIISYEQEQEVTEETEPSAPGETILTEDDI